MKKLLLTSLMVLALARLTYAQAGSVYQNDGQLLAPPQIPPQVDATTFINNGLFNIGFNSVSSNGVVIGLAGSVFFNSQLAPFDFSDVLNYTNRGTMECDTGFKFDNAPAISGFRHPAANFGNANTGQILAGSANSSFISSLVFFAGPGLTFLTGVPQLIVSATNVVNSGFMSAGVDGLISVNGNNMNLSRGTIHVEGFDDANIANTFSAIGIMSQYAGFGLETNVLNVFQNATGPFPGNLALPYPASPFNIVSNAAGFATISFVTPSPFGVAFANVKQPNLSNRCVQVVYINTNLPGITTDVRFANGSRQFDVPVIQWEAVLTNTYGRFGQTVVTNDLYLSDTYGSNPTNRLVTTTTTFSGVGQTAPYNYTFTRNFPNYPFLPPGNTPFNTALYTNAFPATNAFATYGVDVTPVTSFPDPTLPDSTVTNTPGRIEIFATNILDLTGSQITGPNYLKLYSPNHFVGSPGASIISPYMDINLGSTNGLLSVSNVVAPNIPRFTGTIDMWSGRWTNIDAQGITNNFHVLIVNAQLSPTALPQILNCALRAPNVIVSDALNVEQNLFINANNLTITSNGSDAPTPYGQINTYSPELVWSGTFPVLQSLTNFGLISTANSTYFEGIHQTPYYPSNSVVAYNAVVNHGLISSPGCTIWANYFENTGGGLVISNYSGTTTTTNQSALIYSSVGPVVVHAGVALMLNGGIMAPAGDLSITSDSLTVSNHALVTSGALTLTVNGTLTDGGAASSNFWSVGDGMNLTVKPASGDLLGTTISNSAPAGVEVVNIWAGDDRGPSNAGFVNNAAVGHLILDGSNASQFYFGGPDNSRNYALYVDLLELRDSVTNRAAVNGVQTFTAFDIAPNMTVYYARAIIAGPLDVSDKLNGSDGGRLVWVPTYTGPFNPGPAGPVSVQSSRLNQNTSNNVNLAVTMATLPAPRPMLKWSSLAHSTNYVYFSTSLSSTNWVLVTNFVQGSTNTTATFMDRNRTNNSGYYKVQVNPPQP